MVAPIPNQENIHFLSQFHKNLKNYFLFILHVLTTSMQKTQFTITKIAGTVWFALFLTGH